MNENFLPDNLNEWLGAIAVLSLWIVGAAVAWTKLVTKINGVGERVAELKSTSDVAEGRMDRLEKEVSEYRRDVRENAMHLGRVEKGVEEIGEEIRSGNLGLGSQLHAIEKAINEKDLKTQTRLTRIETVQEIEKKIGPIPKDH